MNPSDVNLDQLDAAAEWAMLTEWEGEPWDDGAPPWMRGADEERA